MRYLVNTREKNCSVIALVNALKFQGKRATAKQANSIFKRLTRAPNGGTLVQDSRKLYRKHGITKINKCDWWKVKTLLEQGNAVISVINCTRTRKLPDGTIRIRVLGHAFAITGVKTCGTRTWFYCTNVGGHKWFTVGELTRSFKKGVSADPNERVWFSDGFKVPGRKQVWD